MIPKPTERTRGRAPHKRRRPRRDPAERSRLQATLMYQGQRAGLTVADIGSIFRCSVRHVHRTLAEIPPAVRDAVDRGVIEPLPDDIRAAIARLNQS